MSKKVSHQRRRSSRISVAAFEGLEQRQLMSSAPVVKFSEPTFYFNDIESRPAAEPVRRHRRRSPSAMPAMRP